MLTADGAEDTRTDLAQAIRYAKEITIQVTLQEDTGNGRIYPPYIQIAYGTATIDSYDARSSLPV